MTSVEKDNEEAYQTHDKKEIEAEEKEKMLKDQETTFPVDGTESPKTGPVKSALATDVCDEGREVKPKYIPIGGIKMPGFFSKTTEKLQALEITDTTEEVLNETKESNASNPQKSRFNLACPFTKYFNRDSTNTMDPVESDVVNTPGMKKRVLNGIRLPLAGMFKHETTRDQEAALASLETLDDKVETPDDGMETVNLNEDNNEKKVLTKLPLRERIRQKKFIIDDLVIGVVVVVVAALLVAGTCAALGARGPPRVPPLRDGVYVKTQTSCGFVEGVLKSGAFHFYGIPYAQPPVGELRWKPAQPLNNISLCWNGTLLAHNSTPPCIQMLANQTSVGEEDCLTVDVVTPLVTYDSPRPVVVLVGADTLIGDSPGILKPSAAYARSKDVVFVRPNFRMGPIGFLSDEVISKSVYPHSSGNYGLSDILVALEWVQNNIRHFGGDEKSVTVFGHRAGATLTAVIASLKQSKKLFARAWISSGSTKFPGNMSKDKKFMDFIGCSDIECLRKADTSRILSSVPDTWMSSQFDLPKPNESTPHSWLVQDGKIIRSKPFENWEQDPTVKQRLVFGSTEHSMHSQYLLKRHLNWTTEHVREALQNSAIGAMGLVNETQAYYNLTYNGMVALTSALRDVCPIMTLARRQLNASFYIVYGVGPGGGGNGLAPVGSDAEAILGSFESRTPEQRRFVAAMQQLFYYYVWHGHLPGSESGVFSIGQDALPLKGLPECDFLMSKQLVPNYARVD